LSTEKVLHKRGFLESNISQWGEKEKTQKYHKTTTLDKQEISHYLSKVTGLFFSIGNLKGQEIGK